MASLTFRSKKVLQLRQKLIFLYILKLNYVTSLVRAILQSTCNTQNAQEKSMLLGTFQHSLITCNSEPRKMAVISNILFHISLRNSLCILWPSLATEKEW